MDIVIIYARKIQMCATKTGNIRQSSLWCWIYIKLYRNQKTRKFHKNINNANALPRLERSNLNKYSMKISDVYDYYLLCYNKMQKQK